MRTPLLVAASCLALSLGGATFAQDRPGAPAAPSTERAPATGTAPTTRAAPAGPVGSIGAATLVGVDVKNSAGENIGEIKDVVVDQSGKATSVILGTGGVLGLGERNVPLGWDQVQISRDDGGKLQAVTNLTKEQLEAMPEYTKDRGGWRAK
jgi:sporulation protein YlmC with PRC-barrel domain